MYQFFFNQFSILYFTQLLLSGLITIFFLFGKQKDSRAYVRIGFFLAFTLAFGFGFLQTSLWSYFTRYLIACQYFFSLLAVTLLAQYVFRYPTHHFKKESYIHLIFSIVQLLVFTWYLVFRLNTVEFYLPIEFQWFNYLIALNWIYLIVLGLRSGYFFSENEKLIMPSTHLNVFRRWGRSALNIINHFTTIYFFPQGTTFKQFNMITLILILGSLPTLFTIFYYSSIWSYSTSSYLANCCYLLFLFFFALSYFKFSSEPSSLSKKIVAISLLATMLLISSVGSITIQALGDRFTFDDHQLKNVSIQFVPIGNAWKIIKSEPQDFQNEWEKVNSTDANSIPVQLPFTFPFESTPFTEVFIGSNGILSFNRGINTYHYLEFLNQIPKIAPLYKDLNPEKGGWVGFYSTKDTFWVRWENVPDFGMKTGNTVSVGLVRDGSFIFQFEELSNVIPGFIGFHSGKTYLIENSVNFGKLNGSLWGTGNLYEDLLKPQRDFIHTGSSVFILMIFLSLFFVLLIFPPFYKLTIIKPVKSLIETIKDVKNGNFDRPALIYDDDEIGYLTETFNEMILSIKRTKDEEILFVKKQKEREFIQYELKKKSEELEYAKNLQINMLPHAKWNIDDYEVFGDMRPASEVGGDYYDYIKINDHQYCVAIGDATGHGVGAGLVVGMVKMALINTIRNYKGTIDLKNLFSILNQSFRDSIKINGIGMGLTLAVIDNSSHTVEIYSTGMPFPFFYSHKKKTTDLIILTGPPLGFIPNIEPEGVTLSIEPGDSIIFVSDGFPERANYNDLMWFEDNNFNNMVEILCANYSVPEVIIEKLFEACDQFSGGVPNDDDMTGVIIRRQI